MSHPKIPVTEYPVSPFISARWSARSFADKPLTQEHLNTLFEAASWAPSSMNEQPWSYHVAVRGSQGFEKLHHCLTTGNKPWAANAAALVISTAKRNLVRNGQPNRHHMFDAGASNALLLLQATELGIYGHQMGGFEMEALLQAFDIDPAEWEVACVIALGYLAPAEALDEPFLTRELSPRIRRPLSETITYLT